MTQTLIFKWNIFTSCLDKRLGHFEDDDQPAAARFSGERYVVRGQWHCELQVGSPLDPKNPWQQQFNTSKPNPRFFEGFHITGWWCYSHFYFSKTWITLIAQDFSDGLVNHQIKPPLHFFRGLFTVTFPGQISPLPISMTEGAFVAALHC